MADWMRPAPSPSVELWRPDGPAARAAAAIMANVAAGFNDALVPVMRGARREMRKFWKRLDPTLCGTSPRGASTWTGCVPSTTTER